MGKDHSIKAYDEAVQQACVLEPRTPRWESFEQRRLCTCCNADCNWAYVLQSEPQRMLARHNCFACGRVTCDGCSQNRQALPHIGFTSLVRTCDRCYFSTDERL